MNETLSKIYEQLQGWKDKLKKAQLEIADLNKGGLGDKEREAMKGKPKMPVTIPEPTSKEEGAPDVEEPKGLDSKRKPVTHDECGRPFSKDEELDAKIRQKIKDKMDEKGFGEADATRHIIDRDRGNKQPKPKMPLMQTEHDYDKDGKLDEHERHHKKLEEECVKIDQNGQWSIEKSNYGPKSMKLYNQKDNMKRKEKNTGESFTDIGKNKNTKKYTTSGASMQGAHEAAEAKRQAIKTKQSTKVYTDEEKKALQEKMGKEDLNGNAPGGNENDENTRL